MSKLTEEEKAEVEARKRHKSINARIRDARGETVEVPIGTPEVNQGMGQYIRQSTGRSNGKDNKRALMARKVAAVAKGYLIDDDGEILHDIREKEQE